MLAALLLGLLNFLSTRRREGYLNPDDDLASPERRVRYTVFFGVNTFVFIWIAQILSATVSLRVFPSAVVSAVCGYAVAQALLPDTSEDEGRDQQEVNQADPQEQRPEDEVGTGRNTGQGVIELEIPRDNEQELNQEQPQQMLENKDEDQQGRNLEQVGDLIREQGGNEKHLGEDQGPEMVGGEQSEQERMPREYIKSEQRGEELMVKHDGITKEEGGIQQTPIQEEPDEPNLTQDRAQVELVEQGEGKPDTEPETVGYVEEDVIEQLTQKDEGGAVPYHLQTGRRGEVVREYDERNAERDIGRKCSDGEGQDKQQDEEDLKQVGQQEKREKEDVIPRSQIQEHLIGTPVQEELIELEEDKPDKEPGTVGYVEKEVIEQEEKLERGPETNVGYLHVEEQVIEQEIQQAEEGAIPEYRQGKQVGEVEEVFAGGDKGVKEQKHGQEGDFKEDTGIDQEEGEEIKQTRITDQDPQRTGDTVQDIGYEQGVKTEEMHGEIVELNGIPGDEEDKVKHDDDQENTSQKRQDEQGEMQQRDTEGEVQEETVQRQDEPVVEQYIEQVIRQAEEQMVTKKNPEGKEMRQEYETEGEKVGPEEIPDDSVKLEAGLEGEGETEHEFSRGDDGVNNQERHEVDEGLTQELQHDEQATLELQEQMIPGEPQIEEKPFEKVLRQLGLDKSSRLSPLDQRTIKGTVDPAGKAKRDTMTDFFLQISVGIPDAANNLMVRNGREVLEQVQGMEEARDDVEELGRRDALFAMLSCCDPFLLQEVLRQLVLCGNAVPVITPRPDDESLCLLWGLRKANIPTSHSTEATDITRTPFVTVSAIRLGESSTSKSKALNSMLNKLNCSEERNYFITENKSCPCSCGAVEAAWYLPSKDKATQEAPLAFMNLRGDSPEFPKQRKFCIRASKFIIVFTESFETEDAKSMFQDISPDTRVILVSPTSDVEQPFNDMDNTTLIDTTDRSEDQISQSILDVILGENLSEIERDSFQRISALCDDLGIPIDEDLPECKEAKATATGIIAAMRGKSKEELFPLKNLWKEWVVVNKETLGEHNIEHELSKILQKKKEMRYSQKNSELPTSMDAFVKSLATDSEQKYYVYFWLDILLNEQYDIRDSPKEPTDLDQEGKQAEARGDISFIDITDFQQELGQMVECEHPCLEQDQNDGDKPIFEYFSELQRNGVPLVLFDSDACAIPLEWLEDAFNNLDETSTGSKPRVCVVSIIGRPKSFKTTLLNRLFGVNFSTRAPVSTKGMILQLVPVKHPANEEIGCDFLLIVDTQSFDLRNNPSPEEMERHEYITTLTLCISDLVIVNTRQFQDESEQEFKLLDPSFVRGLVRMREVNKSGKCCLVQHCAANLTQTTDYGTLSAQLFERAKKDLSEEVKSERVKDVDGDLLDVFSLETEHHAMFIPYTESDLELGPSEKNCQQVFALRDLALQTVSHCNRPQMSFDDFFQRITDVTNALKKEEFVKDFRDTIGEVLTVEDEEEDDQNIGQAHSNEDDTGIDQGKQKDDERMRPERQQGEQRILSEEMKEEIVEQEDELNEERFDQEATEDQTLEQRPDDNERVESSIEREGVISPEIYQGEEQELLRDQPPDVLENKEETQRGKMLGADLEKERSVEEHTLEKDRRSKMSVDDELEQGLLSGVGQEVTLEPGEDVHIVRHEEITEEGDDIQQSPVGEHELDLAGDHVREELVKQVDEQDMGQGDKDIVWHEEEQLMEHEKQQDEEGTVPECQQEEQGGTTGDDKAQGIGQRSKNGGEQRITDQDPQRTGDTVQDIGYEQGLTTEEMHGEIVEPNGIPGDEEDKVKHDDDQENTSRKRQDEQGEMHRWDTEGKVQEETVQRQDEPVVEQYIEQVIRQAEEQMVTQKENPEGKEMRQEYETEEEKVGPEEIPDDSVKLEAGLEGQTEYEFIRGDDGVNNQERHEVDEGLTQELQHDEQATLELQGQMIPGEPQIEEKPFEKVLRQLGLDKSSRLSPLDQRTIKETVDPAGKAKRDTMTDFFLQISVGIPDAANNLMVRNGREVLEQEQGIEEARDDIEELGRRDALFAMLSCCDPFLLQEVLRQLVLCGNAVPVITPRPDDESLCLLWGLRKANIPTSHSTEATDITNTPFVTVSAIRLGESSTSKSKALNSMLNKLNCSKERNYFITENKSCHWSCGAVEAAWYLPSKDKATQEAPLAFMNLRGDSLEFPKQVKFCIRASKFIIVFTESFETEDAKSMFQDISPDTHVILVSPTSDVEQPFNDMDNTTLIDTTDRSEDQISQSILDVILGENLSEIERESFQRISALCDDLGIPIDESLPECKEAKATATGIIAAMRGKSKEELFPLKNLWKEWVVVNKETLGEHNIEHELSKILQKKKEMRYSQKNSELPTSMDAFVKSLATDSEQKYYVYFWLDILLNEQYDIRDSPKEPTDLDQEGKQAEARGDISFIDITDFQQELGQMVECEHPCLEQDQNDGDKPIFEYFSELQRNGVPLVLFDSDASAVPLEWLEDAFNNLDETPTGSKPRVCVVSIIGRPKSFKTTLLNRLFGVNFSTRAPVSTKGMILQLVPVKHPANEEIGCDFLLIVDTQSFDLRNNPSPEEMERHEYITTLTLCISDLVIVNTRQFQDESEQEFKLLDPSFVRGLVRMREVNKSGKCCLVQHCAANLTQTTDYGTLSAQLFERAKKDLSEEVKSERVKDVDGDLLDVFSLENEHHAMFIQYTESDLELGPSEQNCQQVFALRDLALQTVSHCNRPQMSFDDFFQRITDVTNALKKEEFVKDFRDTIGEVLTDEDEEKDDKNIGQAHSNEDDTGIDQGKQKDDEWMRPERQRGEQRILSEEMKEEIVEQEDELNEERFDQEATEDQTLEQRPDDNERVESSIEREGVISPEIYQGEEQELLRDQPPDVLENKEETQRGKMLGADLEKERSVEEHTLEKDRRSKMSVDDELEQGLLSGVGQEMTLEPGEDVHIVRHEEITEEEDDIQQSPVGEHELDLAGDHVREELVKQVDEQDMGQGDKDIVWHEEEQLMEHEKQQDEEGTERGGTTGDDEAQGIGQRSKNGEEQRVTDQDPQRTGDTVQDIGYEQGVTTEEMHGEGKEMRQEYETEEEKVGPEEIPDDSVKLEAGLEGEGETEHEFSRGDDGVNNQERHEVDEELTQELQHDEQATLELQGQMIPGEPQIEEKPFEKVLRQLGLDKSSRLSLLDQRTIKETVDPAGKAKRDTMTDFFLQISVGIPDAANNLMVRNGREGLEQEQGIDEARDDIEELGRRDVLFAMLSCCDPFLLQEVLRQLVLCGNAVPVITPRPDDESLCLLWGLRKANIPTSHSTEATDITNTPFVTVSAIRLGESSTSKSKALNSMLNKLNCSEERKYFITENKSCPWSCGAVEAAWYLPSKDKATQEAPLAFMNLRGDSLEFPKQVKFCIRASKFIIVFTESFETEDAKSMFQDISPDTRVILVSPTSDVEQPFNDMDNTILIETTDCSEDQISQSILDVILGENLSEIERESFQRISALCHDLGIPIDESLPECNEAKATATGIIAAMRGKSKEELFPLKKLWKDWVEVNKETLGEHNIEHELSKILQKKKEIRSSQKNSELPTSMDAFVKSLATDSEQKYFVYFWLDILLNEQYDIRDSPKEPTDLDQEGKQAEARGDFGFVDITDFQQELGQMVECEHPCLEQDQNDGDKPIFEYFSELQRNGVPLVLFDSDACAVPLEWLEDAFNNLDETLTGSKPRVCVVSIIGRPKSFKTTLLNRLFGVNFSTRAPVSTKGMILQLVPVKHPANEEIGCDFLLIVDTQSFDLRNNPSPEEMERHEYITTLTLCISDLVIVNTRQFQDESEQEFKLLDPSFVRGLVRMREVNKSGKCCLVQHCAANLTQTTDYGTLSAQLFERAKKDLSEEVKSEREKDVDGDLLDVFSLENEHHAMFIQYTESDLELGPSEQNCQQVFALRDLALQTVSHCNRPQMSFDDFFQRITDITNALKKEEFVKDFRDTNLENLKEEFVLWYRDLLLKLKSDLTSRLAVSCNELSKVPIENIPEAKNAATKELTKEVGDEFGNVKAQIREQLQSREYECLSDQEDYFQQDIDSAKEAFLPKIGESFEEVLKQAEQTRQLTKGLQKEGGKFLSTLSQGIQPESSIESVEEEFEQKQDEFLKRLKRKYPLHKMNDIHQNTEDNMNYMLKQCGEEVEAVLADKSLSDHVDGHEEMSSIDDVKTLRDSFNIQSSAAEQAFETAKDRLFALSENPESFTDSSKEFTQQLKSLEADFETLVENVTMYLFILAKFVSETHGRHLEKEAKQLCSSEWDDAERSAKMQEIEQEVNSDDYQIKHAEPLDLPTVDAKIASVLSGLEGVCSDQEMAVMKDVFASKNVRNCAALPFDLITLQRLDRCFICLLPSLQAEDVKSINDTVNEAKMIMFGKVFGKQRFDHGKTFNEMYSLVQKTIIDDKEEGKRTRAVALVHLSAWSTSVVDVKKLEDLKAHNVANTFEKEQGKICLAFLKSRCGHNCDDLIADIVCDEIEESLCGLVEESIVTRLREYILLETGMFNLKRTFIGTVLRDLCLKEDYLGFANFLKNPNEFGERWILIFIANECNKDNNSLLRNLLTEVVDSQIKLIESVIRDTEVEFGKRTVQSLPTWLQVFQTKFSEQFKTSCRVNTIEILENSTKVEQFDDFTGQVMRNIAEMRPKLEGSIPLPIEGNAGDTKVWLLSLSHEIHIELAAVVRGCIEQCPFCGAACESTLGEHEFHETVLHYPGGVKGWHDVQSLKLFTDICTSAVASSQQYRTPDEQFRPYREYKKDHPRWEIPGKIGEPMEFWQYVFNKFNAQFARHYSCKEGDVPAQWSNITKEEAVRSAEKAYKLNPIVIND